MHELVKQAAAKNFEGVSAALVAGAFTPEQLLDIKDEDGCSILWWAVYHKQHDNDLFRTVISAARSDDLNLIVQAGRYKGCTILLLAAVNEQWDVLNTILSRADITASTINSTFEFGDLAGMPLLFITAKQEQWNLVNIILDRSDSTVDSINYLRNGKSLFWYAVECDALDTIELLKDSNLLNSESINSISTSEGEDHNSSVIWHAAFNDNWPLVLELLNNPQISSASINAIPSRRVYSRVSLLWLVAQVENKANITSVLEKLFSRQDLTSDNFNSIAIDGESEGISVLWHMVENEHWKYVNLMLDRPDLSAESINAVALEEPNTGISVLWQAACCKNWDLVTRLLGNVRLNSNSINTIADEKSVLMLAIEDNRFDIAKLLLEKGCDLDKSLSNVSNKEIIKDLLSFEIDIIEQIRDNADAKYKCSISHSLMLKPVTMTDGHTYESEKIEDWLVQNNTSPMTRERISKTIPRPNIFIMNEISDYIKREGNRLVNEQQVTNSDSSPHKKQKR